MKGIAVLALALALAGCTSAGQSAQSSSPGASASSPAAENVSGGCGQTPIRQGAIPDWASVNAPKELPYVVATPDIAMGYLFSSLTAGPTDNKILWYVRLPRNGQPLTAEGHPLGASGPLVRFSQPANSGPGEIYPSGPSVPAAGCWHFTLTWDGNSAQVDLFFK